MSERPIIFSGPRVRAILDGRKSQTRRIIKPQPDDDGKVTVGEIGLSRGVAYVGNERSGGIVTRVPCPYGQPGDQLWVRETWRIGAWNENTGAIAVAYQADGYSRREWLEIPEDKDPDGETFNRYWIQCSDDCEKAGVEPDADGQYHFAVGQAPTRWRSPIHMPRIASRITLEVTGVRVERLQEISEADARAEGIRLFEEARGVLRDDWHPRKAYADLWDSLNAKRGHGWESNPFVWVIEFRKI